MSNKKETVRKKLLMRAKQHKVNEAMQTESFTCTISHEMRTPIGTVIFFLAKIIESLSSAKFKRKNLPKMVKTCKLMMS